MVVEEKVQAVLIAAAGVTALVALDSIKVGYIGQTKPRPYIEHHPVSLDPTHTYESLLSLRLWDFYQISCFADTYPAVRAIANAVRAVLGSYNGSGGIQSRLRGETPIYEPDVRVFQIALDFDIGESL